jgi:hypothetical protein
MSDRTETTRLTEKVGEIRSLFVEFDHIALIKEDLHDLVACGTSGAESDIHALIGKTRTGKTQLLRGFMEEYITKDAATGKIVLPNGFRPDPTSPHDFSCFANAPSAVQIG